MLNLVYFHPFNDNVADMARGIQTADKVILICTPRLVERAAEGILLLLLYVFFFN